MVGTINIYGNHTVYLTLQFLKKAVGSLRLWQIIFKILRQFYENFYFFKILKNVVLYSLTMQGSQIFIRFALSLTVSEISPFYIKIAKLTIF